jgi:CRP-like cAMP-binding protein
MGQFAQITIVILIGLFTTSSSMLGAAIGLYAPLSKRILACILAFAAGSLISALAIDLAFKGAMDLHKQGYKSVAAWEFIAGGFAIGAVIYFITSLYLEKKGAAIKRPMRFKEYAIALKQEQTKELVGLLSQCDLLRHLPADAIEHILPSVRQRRLHHGEILFHAGDPSNSLFIIANGWVEVVGDSLGHADGSGASLAKLGPGSVFGEMGLISGGGRTATIRSAEGADLLEIGSEDFNALIAADPVMAHAMQHLSHERAIHNLSSGGTNPSTWAKVAMQNLEHVSHNERNKMLREAGQGAGMAIVLGNILDTIPGCLVIGASFKGFQNLSLTLMFGMFLGGIPEAAVSAAMLTKAGYKPKIIFALWSTVLIAGMVAAAAGKEFIGGSETHAAVFFQAVAGGAVLALVSHAMIPEAIHEGGSLVVLPTVLGFLFALFLAMSAAFV